MRKLPTPIRQQNPIAEIFDVPLERGDWTPVCAGDNKVAYSNGVECAAVATNRALAQSYNEAVQEGRYLPMIVVGPILRQIPRTQARPMASNR